MLVKNIEKIDEIKSIDASRIKEVFGMVNDLKKASLAYAIVAPLEKTEKHFHKFLEFYIIVKGKGLMKISEEEQEVKEGDCIVIPERHFHQIENTGENNLEFYCVCIPAFNESGTTVEKEEKE